MKRINPYQSSVIIIWDCCTGSELSECTFSVLIVSLLLRYGRCGAIRFYSLEKQGIV
jgi:hypothetical protein